MFQQLYLSLEKPKSNEIINFHMYRTNIVSFIFFLYFAKFNFSATYRYQVINFSRSVRAGNKNKSYIFAEHPVMLRCCPISVAISRVA